MRKTLTILALLLLSSTAAQAEKVSPLKGQGEVRHRPEMRKGRFEATPQFVVSTNQDFKHFVGGGLALRYNFTDWLGVGVAVAGGTTLNSGLTDRINAVLDNAEAKSQLSAFQPTKKQFNDHLVATNLLLSIYGTLTPIAGKLAIFNALYLKYDIYGMIGLGFQNLSNTWKATDPGNRTANDCANNDADPRVCDPVNSGFKVSGMFGAGVHLYFNDWVGLNLELRDFLNSTNPAGFDVNGDQKISSKDETVSNNFFVGIGVSFVLPITPKVSP